MSITRIVYTDKNNINGKDVIIRSIESLNYDGVWEGKGYEVECGIKKKIFIGYPTHTDIINFINNKL
jgi:hypothetical protein